MVRGEPPHRESSLHVTFEIFRHFHHFHVFVESITPAHRWTRQTASAPYPSSQKQQQQQQQSIPNPAPNAFVSGTQKLDALATLLVSTRAALRDLQLELQTNLSKLSQQNG